MPTISELSDSELLLKYDKLNDYLELIKKEVKRRGLRKTFTEHISSWFDTDEVEVTRPRPSSAAAGTNVREHITKVKRKPITRQMQVVSDSSSDEDDPAVKRGSRGGGKSKTKPKSKQKSKTKKVSSSASVASSKSSKSTGSKKKREVEKATIPEIKHVLKANNVKFGSKDNKAKLLELASKHCLINTIVYYKNKNSKS